MYSKMPTDFFSGSGCEALLREEGVIHLQKLRNMKAERLSSTSVRKGCLPSKFMKTSW